LVPKNTNLRADKSKRAEEVAVEDAEAVEEAKNGDAEEAENNVPSFQRCQTCKETKVEGIAMNLN
jgi:hypothetical protein